MGASPEPSELESPELSELESPEPSPLSSRARGLTIRVGVGCHPDSTVEQLIATALAAEELGYDSLWLGDTATGPGFAPLPALAAVAAHTARLKLGTSVLVLPPRNPVLLARELATIDVLSAGRLLPAAGLGLADRRELDAVGLSPAVRVARLEEAIEVILRLWSGERVEFVGRFTTLHGVRLQPRPTRSRLELWLGGRSPAALDRIGRLASGWLASLVSPSEFAAGCAEIRSAASRAARTIDEDHYGTTLFATAARGDRERASPLVAQLAALRADLALEDHLARGPDELVALLERFVAVGASKFVVVALDDDVPRWLEEMRPAIAEVERGGGGGAALRVEGA
ncbi:MAG: LLM class flavin-dependent oxidoreductase [Solirubrobacteraceae bacterium]